MLSCSLHSRFILNLENLENRPFFGVVRENKVFSYLVYISFSLTIGIAVRKVVALIIASKCELYHLVL